MTTPSPVAAVAVHRLVPPVGKLLVVAFPMATKEAVVLRRRGKLIERRGLWNRALVHFANGVRGQSQGTAGPEKASQAGTCDQWSILKQNRLCT